MWRKELKSTVTLAELRIAVAGAHVYSANGSQDSSPAGRDMRRPAGGNHVLTDDRVGEARRTAAFRGNVAAYFGDAAAAEHSMNVLSGDLNTHHGDINPFAEDIDPITNGLLASGYRPMVSQVGQQAASTPTEGAQIEEFALHPAE